MEHVNGWCFRGIYKGGLWEDDLHVSALVGQDYLPNVSAFSMYFDLNPSLNRLPT